MIFEERQVLGVLLSQNVEPLLAAQVADAMNGVLGQGIGESDNQVQFDGVVKASQWPDVYAKLSAMPSRMVQVEEMSTPGGNVEFTLRVSEDELTRAEADHITGGLRSSWSDDETETVLDNVRDEMDTVDIDD